MKELERTLKALANRRRLIIVQFLTNHQEAAVTDIAEQIPLSVKATSRHLQKLFSADILERRQRDKLVYYSLASSPPPLAKSMLKFL